jgi:hypothetical protein
MPACKKTKRLFHYGNLYDIEIAATYKNGKGGRLYLIQGQN